MSVENVLLVAGFNYENVRNPTFLQGCANRMARLLGKATSGADLVFTLFDVGAGVIQQSKTDPATKKRAWTELQRFSAVTTANYSSFVTGKENHFDTSPSGVMSITDVYQFVQAIGGGADHGTVTELSFFSHGWMGGPILVNSFEALSTVPAKRDPNDKDARTFKDFVAPNMDDKAAGHFGAAFAATALVWIWGCSFARPAHIVLAELFKSSKYRSTPVGRIKDSDKFTLDFSVSTPTPTADDLDAIVNIILPGGRRSGRSYTANVTFLDIKNAFDKQIANTYCAKMSAASGAKTFGALPGTYADEEKNVRLPLMVVPTRKPPYDDNLTATLTFYKTYMGVKLDPENRGYGTF